MSRLSWASYSTNLEDNRKRATEIWMHMGKRRRWQWTSFMLQELKARPRRALIPLDVALQNPGFMPRRRILADCILMLAKYLLHNKAMPLRMDVRMLHQFVCDYAIMNSSFIDNSPFQQMTIWLIMDRCDDSQVRSLFETLLTRNLPVSSYTLLQFAAKFMDLGQAHVGLELIRNTVRMGADTSSYAIQSSCVKLLRIRPERDAWYDYQNKVVTELLDVGIRPKSILWTCIIHNAVEAGRFEAAWRWYNIGINDGLKPRSETISILLKIVKQQKNEDTLYYVIDEAHKAGVLPNDAEVVFDLLHAVLIIEQSKLDTDMPSEGSFPVCLKHYTQYCDIGPLQELGWQLGPASEWQQGDRQLPAPSPTIIGIMIVAYIRQTGALEDYRNFYIRYDDLVTSKHPLIAPLANTDHIGNAFLMRFGNNLQTLPFCTTVINSMMKSSPCGISLSSKLRSTTPGQSGQPTLQTWNILLRAYMKNGRTEAAEKVFSMLKERGLRPDRVTWNHLISGYSDRQDLPNIIAAVRAMKSAGIEFDEMTIKYLQRIADKPRFFKAMDDDGESKFQVYYGGDERSSQSQIESQTHDGILEKRDSAQMDEEMAAKHQVRLEYDDY